MIDPKEIRIGNYLHGSHQESEEVLEVAGISKSTDWLIFYNRISDGAKHLNPNSFFSPIPLTEDWLLKFGFEKISGMEFSYFKHWGSNGLDFLIWLPPYQKFGYQLSNHKHKVMEWVHQLQNGWKFHTNEELIYNENHK